MNGFHLHCRVNEGGIKLQIFSEYSILRPWFAKHKMSVNDFSQKIGRNIIYSYALM